MLFVFVKNGEFLFGFLWNYKEYIEADFVWRVCNDNTLIPIKLITITKNGSVKEVPQDILDKLNKLDFKKIRLLL